MHACRALRRRTGDHKRHALICSGTGVCARLLRIPPPSRDLPLRPAQMRAREAQDRDQPSHQVYLAKRAAPRVPGSRNCGPATIVQPVQPSGAHLCRPMAHCLLGFEALRIIEFRNRCPYTAFTFVVLFARDEGGQFIESLFIGSCWLDAAAKASPHLTEFSHLFIVGVEFWNSEVIDYARSKA